MWFGKAKDDNHQPAQQGLSSSQSIDRKVNLKKQSERQRLPPQLQRIVDQADEDNNIYDDSWAGTGHEPTEFNIRYAGYASRIRTLLNSTLRYVAYTSDMGGSLRRLARPNLVRGAYAVSWTYVLVDAAHEGHKTYLHNQQVSHPGSFREAGQGQYHDVNGNSVTDSALTIKPRVISPLEDYRTVVGQRVLFHSMASMGLPAFTIHNIVKYTGRAMKGVKSNNLRTWAPIGLALSVVPFFPYIFDKPMEKAVGWIFYRGFETFGGKEAVGDATRTSREK